MVLLGKGGVGGDSGAGSRTGVDGWSEVAGEVWAITVGSLRQAGFDGGFQTRVSALGKEVVVDVTTEEVSEGIG
jgi:hypothetical protein